MFGFGPVGLAHSFGSFRQGAHLAGGFTEKPKDISVLEVQIEICDTYLYVDQVVHDL